MAGNRKEQGAQVQFGAICLPVMTCVLAAVLFMSEKNAPPPVVASEASRLAQLEPQVIVTRQRLEKISNRIKGTAALVSDRAQLTSNLERMAAEIARLNKEQAALTKNVSESQERSALLQKIAARNAELAALSNAIAQVAGQRAAIVNRVELAGMDEFPRPYVSIECSKDTAKVYAPKQPVRVIRPPLGDHARLAGDDLDWLRTQIVASRAVVVFARTESFEDCYWKCYGAVLKIQDDEENKKAEVAVSFVPIQNHEDITGHILLGGGP